MNCPSCNAPLDDRGVDLDAGTVRCFNCGHVSALSTGPEAAAVKPLPPPARTRVVVDRSRPGEILVRIPGKGGWSMLVFAAIWLCLTFGIGSGFIAGGAPWPVFLFFVPFLGIGCAMLLFGLFSRYGVTGVYLDSTQYFVTKRLWGKGWQRRGPLEAISSISITEAYRENDCPVRAVTINTTGRTIKFGSFLSNDEKEWIASELRAFMADIDRP